MPIDDRDYVRGQHPPACTCKECTEKRLGKFKSQNSRRSWSSPRVPISNLLDKIFDKTKRAANHHTGTTKQSRGQSKVSNRSIIRNPGKLLSRIRRRIPTSILKLFLSLLVIAGLVDIIRRGYLLFTQQTDPVRNIIIFLVEVGVWFWIIAILRSRRYKYRKPKFKLVLTTVIAITLVCAFAGIEPLSSYKDNIIGSVSDYLEERQAIREAAEIAEAEELATAEEARVEAEKAAERERIQAEALVKIEAERNAEEEARAEAERIIQETLKTEKLAFDLINNQRMLNGLMPTRWDGELYRLSKLHTQAMSDKGELFHSSMNDLIGEDAWGGLGYSNYDYNELAQVIVESWMSSPLHKAWILHGPIQTSVISIVITPNSQFASWTFWMSEVEEGPELVQKIADEWRKETGESIPWIEWLYMKGYLH